MMRKEAWCEEIDDALLMPTWTLERLRFLLHRVKRHTAAGPSGLSYMLLLHAPVAFRQAFVDTLQACPELGYIPEEQRHSHIYPIGKSGPRGGTLLDGARQICLIEVFLKLSLLNMSVEASAIWHARETQSKLQTGFKPESEPAGTGSVVIYVMADARRKGKPMFMLVADIAKAFQAIPIWGMYLAARIQGMSHRAASFWLETERCGKMGNSPHASSSRTSACHLRSRTRRVPAWVLLPPRSSSTAG